MKFLRKLLIKGIVLAIIIFGIVGVIKWIF